MRRFEPELREPLAERLASFERQGMADSFASRPPPRRPRSYR